MQLTKSDSVCTGELIGPGVFITGDARVLVTGVERGEMRVLLKGNAKAFMVRP